MRRDIPLLIIENIVRHKNISNNSFHIVLISNVHLMTFTVQAAFRRLMEKYVRSCRFIFVNKNRNGIIDALRSRCLHLSFIKPGFIQYRQMLEHIAGCESLDISDEIYEKVYEHSNGIIDGVNLLQLYSLNKKAIDYKEKYSPYNEIVFYIRKGDIRYFKKIQEILFTLHSLDVSFTDIIKNIIKKIIRDKGTSDKKKIKATSIAADCDWRCVKSNREIVQLNLFIGRLIELYQKKI